MIANQVKGSGFRGCLNYLTEERHNPELIGGNMAGKNARELSSEFKFSREMRPTLNKPVYHVSLSVPGSERMQSEQWREIGERYMREMGFDNSQYVIIRHNDKGHDHIHMVGSRVRMDNGKVVSDSHDYRRSARVVQGIEQDYSLKKSAKTPEQVRQMSHRGPTSKEKQRALRTNQQDSKMSIQNTVRMAADDQPKMSQFIDRMQGQGVGVRANIASTGRISGVSFVKDGVAVKGSSLGKSYSWQGLQKKFGVKYDPKQDFNLVKEAAQRTQKKFSKPEKTAREKFIERIKQRNKPKKQEKQQEKAERQKFTDRVHENQTAREKFLERIKQNKEKQKREKERDKELER